MIRFIIYSLVGSLLLFSSCKKKDTIEPTIQITSPKEGKNYGINDGIEIEAKIKDNNIIEYIEIQLVDDDLLSAQAQKRIEIASDSYELSYTYTITNEEIETGTYYLRLSAFDGVNTQNEYVELHVDGTPLTRLGFVITSLPSSDQVEIGFIDLQGSYSQMALYSGRDHIGSSVSSKFQSTLIVGEHTGDLVSVNTETYAEEWNVPVIGSALPYFTSIDHYNDLTYVGHYDGQLKGYNENGSADFLANASSNYFFTSCYTHDGYILAQENEINSSSMRLITYYDTGFELQWDEISMNIEDYASLNSNEVILFGNENGQGKILIYSVSDRGFWEPKTLPTGEVYSATQIDENTFIIGHETGLLEYNYSQSAVTTFSGETNVGSMLFDDLHGQLIIADDNSVKVFEYPNSGGTVFYTHSSDISEVHILNNR